MRPVHTLKHAMTKTMPMKARPTGPNACDVRFVSTVAPVSVVGSMAWKVSDTAPTNPNTPYTMMSMAPVSARLRDSSRTPSSLMFAEMTMPKYNAAIRSIVW